MGLGSGAHGSCARHRLGLALGRGRLGCGGGEHAGAILGLPLLFPGLPGGANLPLMALVQGAVAHHQQNIHCQRQHQEPENDLDPSEMQHGFHLMAHILQLGQRDGGAGHQRGGAVHHAVLGDGNLAQHLSGGDGSVQILAAALVVDDDLPGEAGQVLVLGQQRSDHVLGPHGDAVRVRAHFHLHLGHQLAGGQNLLHAEVAEGPVVEGDGVLEVAVGQAAVGVLDAGAAQHHADQVDAVLLGGGDQAVAGGGGVAGFHATGVFVVVALVVGGGGVDESVGVGKLALRGHVGGGHGVAHGVADLHEQVKAHRLLGDQEHIAGGGVVIFVGQTVGVGKVGAGAAQLLGAGIHHVHKAGDGACYVFADDVAGLVGALHHGAVQQILQGHDLAGGEVGGAAGLVHAHKAVLRRGHLVVKGHVAPVDGLDGQQHGHHLGEGGGVHLGVHVLGEEDAAGVRVRQYHRTGGHGGVVQRQSGGGKRCQQHTKQQDYGQYSTSPTHLRAEIMIRWVQPKL